MFVTKDKWMKINNYHLIAIIFILLITQFFLPWQILVFETILIFLGSVSLILTDKIFGYFRNNSNHATQNKIIKEKKIFNTNIRWNIT